MVSGTVNVSHVVPVAFVNASPDGEGGLETVPNLAYG